VGATSPSAAMATRSVNTISNTAAPDAQPNSSRQAPRHAAAAAVQLGHAAWCSSRADARLAASSDSDASHSVDLATVIGGRVMRGQAMRVKQGGQSEPCRLLGMATSHTQLTCGQALLDAKVAVPLQDREAQHILAPGRGGAVCSVHAACREVPGRHPWCPTALSTHQHAVAHRMR
jgi:hypothetical protein